MDGGLTPNALHIQAIKAHAQWPNLLNKRMVESSILTGEAFAVSKVTFREDPFILANVGDFSVNNKSLVFAGTRVLTGLAKMRVLCTGRLQR